MLSLAAWSVGVSLVKDDLVIVFLITSLRIGHFLLDAWVTRSRQIGTCATDEEAHTTNPYRFPEGFHSAERLFATVVVADYAVEKDETEIVTARLS